MKCVLEHTDEIFIIWAGVFEALSVSQSDHLRDALGFPLPLTDELRDLAQNFMLSYLMITGHPIPEQPSINLLYSRKTKDHIKALWENIFRQLRAIKYADDVYRWGKKTYCNYIGQNNPVIKEKDWDKLLCDWANNPTHPTYAPLSLSSQKITQLQSIIVRYDVAARNLRLEIEQIEKTPKTSWEQFAFDILRVGTWMHNQSQFMTRVARWTEIFDLLNTQEIEILETWGWRLFPQALYSPRVPLVRFSL